MTNTTDTTLTADDLDPVFFLAATDPAAMKRMNTEVVAGFRATGGSWVLRSRVFHCCC